MKYLTLIRAIALLHQHQRPRRTIRRAGVEVTYIEVIPADVALANRLAHEVLGRSLDDLAPQTSRLLDALHALVNQRATAAGVERADVRFSRREVREAIGWTDFQVRTHLGRLVDLEWVLVHRGGRGLCFVYDLAWDGGGVDGRPHLAGLIDAESLVARGYDPNLAVSAGHFEGASSPHRAQVEDTADQLGSIRAITDAAGAVTATFSFDTFGLRTAATSTATTNFGFAGEYTDAETGFVYLRGRYYDPSSGQFLNPTQLNP